MGLKLECIYYKPVTRGLVQTFLHNSQFEREDKIIRKLENEME
jgi:hypothetical protein